MNKIRFIIDELGFDYKNEIIKFAILNLMIASLTIVVYLLKLQYYFYFFVGGGLVLFDYLFISSYFTKYNEYLANHDEELVSLLSYFQVFIVNKQPIYKALQSLLDYSSDWMKEKISILLSEIDNDKTVQPFINFSKNFQNLIFESLCISIYQMIDEGENIQKTNEFVILFNEISESQLQLRKSKKRRGLESLSSLPLFGAGFITVIVIISVVSVIGDMINVI